MSKLGDLETKIMEASKRLDEAALRASEARKTETDCRNSLNTLQKQLDEELEALRKSAPRDTDWFRTVHGRVSGTFVQTGESA